MPRRTEYRVYAVIFKIVDGQDPKAAEEINSASCCGFENVEDAERMINDISETCAQGCDDTKCVDKLYEDEPDIKCAGCGIPIPDPGEYPDPAALLCDNCDDECHDGCEAPGEVTT